jgi:hypothetical protein
VVDSRPASGEVVSGAVTSLKFFASLLVRMKSVPSRCSTSYLWPFSRGSTTLKRPSGVALGSSERSQVSVERLPRTTNF